MPRFDGTPEQLWSLLVSDYGVDVEGFGVDDEEAALMAVLLELRAIRRNQAGTSTSPTLLEEQQQTEEDGANPSDDVGLYRSETVQVSTSEWTELNLDFVTREVDLRFDDAIRVSFGPPSAAGNTIGYGAADSPVAGIPVQTGEVHLRAQSGTGGTTVGIELWSKS